MDPNNLQDLSQQPVAPQPQPAPVIISPDPSDTPAPIIPLAVSAGPVVPVPESPKKRSPLVIIAIILALVAVLAVVAYVFGVKFLKVQPTPTPIAVVTPSPTPIAVVTESPTPSSTSGIPADLVAAVKLAAVNDSNPKVTADKISIGQSQVEGNYASVAFGINNSGGAIFWLVKTNGIWKVITEGQEPPACTLLKSYNFPADFGCNP